MAIVSSFPYSNTTANTGHELTPTKLSVVTNYGLDETAGDRCVLTNTTCAVDRPEKVSYQSRKIKTVNTSLTNVAPPKINTGVQYSVQTETVLTSEDASIGYRVDDPIVVTISVRHTLSGHITDTHIKNSVLRAVSYLFKDDGSSRLPELMRGSEQPKDN